MDFSHPPPHGDSEPRKKIFLSDSNQNSFVPPWVEESLPLNGGLPEVPKEAGYYSFAWPQIEFPKGFYFTHTHSSAPGSKSVSTQIHLEGKKESDFANLVRSFGDMYENAAKRGYSFSIAVTCPSSDSGFEPPVRVGTSEFNALEFQWTGEIEKCKDVRLAEASGTYPREKLIALARMWGDKATDAEFAARPDVQGYYPDGGGWVTDPSSFWRLHTNALDFLRGGHIDEEEIVFVSMQPRQVKDGIEVSPGEKIFMSEHLSSFGALGTFHAMEVFSYFYPGDTEIYGVKLGRVDPRHHV